jgi:hypothetical protein
MNKYQLKNFKMNTDIASELADKTVMSIDHKEIISTIQYPSLLRMLSDNLLRGFDQVELTVIHGTSDAIDVVPADTPRIFVPIIGGSNVTIKFADGTEFKLDCPVVFESQAYTLTVPAGEKLVMLSSPINYDKSFAKFVTNKLETFAHPML